MFSSQIYHATLVNYRCTGGFTYFALHFIHATFCIEPRNICILRPDDVYHLSEEGTGGKFIYKTEDEQILVEGTYQIEWASLGGKQKKAFVFTYIDKNNVEQQHTFFNFSPYLGTQSSTRERGPITTAWLEEVSDSPYLEGVLPADRTVVYWVDTVISSLSAEDL